MGFFLFSSGCWAVFPPVLCPDQKHAWSMVGKNKKNLSALPTSREKNETSENEEMKIDDIFKTLLVT